MSLLSDKEIRQAIEAKLLAIDPFSSDNLKAASYDVRLGKRAIVTKSISLDELQGKVAKGEVPELNIEKEGSIAIPGGGFGLVVTLESIKTTGAYVGHIGMKTYYVRKGLVLLSGLQIDPWWEGVLVLGLANLSPRSITLDYEDDLGTIEFHKLSHEVEQKLPSPYMAEQKDGRIPRSDRDYLRTIETMSVSDLTTSLLSLSNNVEALGKQLRNFWYPLLAITAAVAFSFIALIVALLFK